MPGIGFTALAITALVMATGSSTRSTDSSRRGEVDCVGISVLGRSVDPGLRICVFQPSPSLYAVLTIILRKIS